MGGDFGAESKKLPPPPNMPDEEVEGGDLALVKESRPEKGEDFEAGAAGAPKPRPPNASLRPPKDDCCAWGDCWEGEARPPKESCRACCWGWGGAVGFAAYRDRMDCLRSGREGAAAAAAGPVLEGRAGCADALPRKSSPSRESPALVCFGGAGSAFGGTARAWGGPVLARGGAGVSSPNKSMAGCGGGAARGGGGVCEDAPPRRCDAERSIWTFSWTFFRGCWLC